MVLWDVTCTAMRIDICLITLVFSLFEVLSSKYQCQTFDATVTSFTSNDLSERFPRRVAKSAPFILPHRNKLHLLLLPLRFSSCSQLLYYKQHKPTSSVVRLRHHSPEFVLRIISRMSRTNIEELSLDSNGLTYLPRKLVTLSKIKSVSLADNKIADISNISVVNGLPRLRSLALSRNPLRNLAGLTTASLETLVADHCEIDAFDGVLLESLPGLKTLNLTGNPLGAIGELSSSSLTELVLKDCRLDYLYPETFRELTNLTYLDLQENELNTMPDAIFLTNHNLRYLNLRKNRLKVVRKSWFNGTKNLETLHLTTNRIMSIRETDFAALPTLTNLDLAENNVTTLPNLETAARDVNFSMNSIGNRGLWDLSRMTRIQRLDMSYNRLEGNCGAFKSPSLGILILGHNKLTTFRKDSFANLPNLSDINLKGNRISAGISPTIFQDNLNLVNVKLDDNPWNCNCTELYPMYFYLASGQRTKTMHLICASPKNATGHTWWDFCSQNWRELMVAEDHVERATTWIITISVVFGSCVIFGTMVYITYTFKKNRPVQPRNIIN